MVGKRMQQDTEKHQILRMTSYITPHERKRVLLQLREFEQALPSSVELLAEKSELIELRQGQTLLRASLLETHAFIVIEGSLRLLAEEPFKKELFSVGKAKLDN